MKIVTIVGARPQFIKAAPLSVALKRAGIEEYLVDTGQHYDMSMAGAFFSELGLPHPSHSLGVGSGSHGKMTGRMLEKIEAVLEEVGPDGVVVFGDTNSTLAGAVAAAKMSIPVFHVEAGLRSFRQTMPEEINRRITDHVSRVLFCPTAQAVQNLIREGIAGGETSDNVLSEKECASQCLGKNALVLNVGDIMVDSLKAAKDRDVALPIVDSLGKRGYILVTLHRAESTNDEGILRGLIEQIYSLGKEFDVLFPLHPRTRNKLTEIGLLDRFNGTRVHCLEPLPYGQFIKAQMNAKVIVTDSGGVQKEACMLGTPCLTLREETEWTETVDRGWNQLLGVRPVSLVSEVRNVMPPENNAFDLYGDGRTAQRIAAVIRACFRNPQKVETFGS